MMWPKSYLANLAVAGIVLVTITGSVYLVFKTVYINSTPPYPPVVTLEGIGREQGIPTVAAVQIGVVSQAKDAAKVYIQNVEKANKLVAAFKELGIEEEDLQTQNYSLGPQYTYDTQNVSHLLQYEMSQTIRVKVRDLGKIGQVLAKATELGSNQITGPEFVIDDEKPLIEEARKKAFEDLKEKQVMMAQELGGKFGRLTSYSEWIERNPYAQAFYYGEKGGGGGMGAGSPTPNIQPGSLELILHMNVSYELK
ncbi:MAG: SIMPL domain-containing protein [Candidatus Peregrinibacteria bacterium]